MRPKIFSSRLLVQTFAALVAVLALACLEPDVALAQSDQSRVLWQLDFDPALSTAQRDEVQAVVLQTLSRAKERHFAGDSILTQKLKKEGLNFPECFTEGLPCTGGGAFVLDVHNVDAFAKARFSYSNKEWTIVLNLYQSMSSSSVQISKTGASLTDLMQKIAGSLFELEAGLEISSTVPDVEIYINQILVGKTPMRMKTSAGEQTIVFKKNGYVSESWQFTAEKGGIYVKDVDLRPEETQLTVLTTAEDAYVVIDGEEWGLANETHNILPGEHKIEIQSETHQTYSQDYKLYPGTPQTIQVALLPNSRSTYYIRHDGILKYRLSASLGYHFGTQELRFGDSKIGGHRTDFSETAYFNGISLALNYENEYWGVQILRLDIGGSGMSSMFTAGEDSYSSDSAMFFGLYPAQIKAHHTFWVMQAEASFGLGYSLIKLDAKKGMAKKSMRQDAFSLDFSLGLKYFFSEESFAMLAYDLQYDVVDKSKARHGFTLGVGLQFPIWMRNNDAPDPDLDEVDSEENSNVSSDNSDEQISEILESVDANDIVDTTSSENVWTSDNANDILSAEEEVGE